MVMKKFINNPDNLTAELLEGLVISEGKIVKLEQEKLVCRVEEKPKDKVALVTLGGAGHEPALSGFVGYGMLDVSVVGDIFAAPGAPDVLEGLKLADRPAGTLLVILNHAGDVLNGTMGLQMAEEMEGLKNIRSINTHDDIAPGADAPIEDRRGLGGCIPLFKIAGAAAELGWSLDEVCRVANKFNDNVATLAVAAVGATHPQTGGLIAELGDDEMEIGMGQHGEAGTGRCKMLSADETVAKMMEPLLDAVKAQAGDKIMVLVNGSGAATPMELLIVARAAKKFLDGKNMELAICKTGEMLTVQETAGFQLIVAKVDDEIIDLWNQPCKTPAWSW
ncbi:MAG: dihydroxyacetone kinase subunit DhaK [Planctomycetia bacterium]|nr:dihydroxyacetone kinase subunit DhaK [Planctomycetia bacterium]